MLNGLNLKMLLVLFLILILITSSNLLSQSLINGAESVAFDSLNNRYLVTSLNSNKIISIDKEGNQSIFKENIRAFGNCIKDSILYVTGGGSIRGLNLFTSDIQFLVTIPGVQQFDGITTDDSGNLYAMATRIKKVYKINIATKSYEVIADSGFSAYPQDLFFDRFNSRVLVCQFAEDSPLLAIDITTSKLTTLVEKTAGYADGITMDKEGNVYVTSYRNGGEIYKYDNKFSKPGELIFSGIEEPSGIDYNIIDDILAVPSFSGNNVYFIKMPNIYLFPKVGISEMSGQAPFTIEFTDLSSSFPKISKWEWDFNSDGQIDSYEQNPKWTYTDSGVYKVSGIFYSDSLSKPFMMEDSIVIFNGESSLNFINTNSIIKIAPSQELNFTNEWTFEAWINPTSLHGKYILDKNNIEVYTNRRSSGFKKNSLVIKFVLEDDSIIRFSTEDSSLSINKWQHISISYDYSYKELEVIINSTIQKLSIEDSTIFSKK